jgi:porin
MGKIIYSLIFLFSISLLVNAQEKYGRGSELKNISMTNSSSKGLKIEPSLYFDYANNFSGGLKTGSDYSSLLELSFDFDLEKLVNLKGGNFYTKFIAIRGGEPSNLVGAIQSISNIEAPNMVRIYEGWYKHNFINQDLSILIGIRDLNSEFDVINTAGLFINSSHGLGGELAQTGELGPSTYPHTAFGIELIGKLKENLTIKAIALEGVPGKLELDDWKPNMLAQDKGFFVATELALSFNLERQRASKTAYDKQRRRRFCNRRRIHGRSIDNNINQTAENDCNTILKIGGWFYTSEFDDIYEAAVLSECKKYSDNFGLYTSLEYIHFIGGSNNTALGTFARFGIANPDINCNHYYVGAGLTLSNIFTNKDDQFGVSTAVIKSGEKFKKILTYDGYKAADYEAVFEVTYRYNLFDYFIIQPDIQYIINPGAVKDINNAFVFILRTELSL